MYLEKLTNEEWLEMEKRCFCSRVAKKFKKVRCADGEYEVTFKEWWSGSWLETRYAIYDFYSPECWDTMVYEEDVKCFYEFMYEKFGNPYAVDFFKARTGVEMKEKENGTNH